MKRLAALFILILLAFSAFAAESGQSGTAEMIDEPPREKKVKVTRRGPSVLTLDAGLMLYIPLNDDSAKGAGLMGGGTITPLSFKSLSLGFRAEAYLFAGKGIIDSDNKKTELKAGFAGTFIANYPLAKSFEVYGGAGAGFIFEEFESLTEFEQTWGIVVQGGGRGRLYNHIGVGAEFNLMFDIPNESRHLSLLGYFSVEF